MPIHMSPSCEQWVFHSLEHPVSGQVFMGWSFNPVVRQQLSRAQRQAFPYVYTSLNRPLTYREMGLSQDDGLIISPSNKPYTYVACRDLLDFETMSRFELYPLGDTRADVLLAIVTDEDLPICLIAPDLERLHLGMVHPDTRELNMHRVTHFGEDGAHGHELYPTVREAVAQLFRSGFNTLVPPTLLDDMSANFQTLG